MRSRLVHTAAYSSRAAEIVYRMIHIMFPAESFFIRAHG